MRNNIFFIILEIMEYYIMVNGAQEGPYPKEMLRMKGLTADSYVWCAGLPTWVKASDVPELASMLEDSAFGGYAQAPTESTAPPQQPQYGYGPQPQYAPGMNPRDSYGRPERIPHFDWQGWAIAGTILGFLTSLVGGIFGIIGIVQANKANEAYARGDKYLGDAANSSAKVMTIISLAISGIVIGLIILSVLFVFVFAAGFSRF